MKKQVSPVPTPRAAALSQSASRFSAGATSAWQRIASSSPRLAPATRVVAPLAPPTAPETSRLAPEPQRAVHAVAPVAEPQTIRQVGWREVDRAVGVSTKRKYNLFGIGFGPKVPVFETEQVKLPVYQETDRNKQYYAAVKAEDVDRIKREGFRARSKANHVISPQRIWQFTSQDYLYFFSDEASAREYAKLNMDCAYATVAFVMPEYYDFMFGAEPDSGMVKLSESQLLCATQSISPECIIKITRSAV